MRLTIDIDDLSKEKLRWTCRKGKKLCDRRPDRIYRTRHGYHLIWDAVKKFGRDITEEEMFELRRKLGDDENRIKLDLHGHRIRQVLFDQKQIRFYNCPDESDRTLVKIESFKRVRVR
jgi:hypothetical protein